MGAVFERAKYFLIPAVSASRCARAETIEKLHSNALSNPKLEKIARADTTQLPTPLDIQKCARTLLISARLLLDDFFNFL